MAKQLLEVLALQRMTAVKAGCRYQVKQQGFDYIKVYHTLEDSLYESLMKYANQATIPVVGHMPLTVDFEETLGSGQYSIEHIEIGQLERISPTLDLEAKAALLGKSKVWVCPTLIVFKKMNSKPGDPGLSRYYEQFVDPKTLMFWRRRLTGHPNQYALRQQFAQILYQNGGLFLTETDALNAYILPGFSLHEELAEIAKLGISNYEVLAMSTVNTAKYLNLLEESGTVSVGKWADLVLLDQNPLEDIENTRSIQGVMIQGRWLGRMVLDSLEADLIQYYQREVLD